MKRKIIWLVVSLLMALSLVLASCAPAVTEKKEVVMEKETVTKEDARKNCRRAGQKQKDAVQNLQCDKGGR